jgi:hypothetical protein
MHPGVVCTAFFVCCSLDAAAHAPRDPQEYAKIDNFVSRPLGMSPHQSLADLRKIGAVKRETSRQRANRHTKDQVDEIRTLYFDGLVVHALFPGKDYNHGLLGDVVISGARWTIEHGLQVGATKAAVTRAFGEPDAVSGEELKYCGDTSCVSFLVRDGRVRRVTFEGYLD